MTEQQPFNKETFREQLNKIAAEVNIQPEDDNQPDDTEQEVQDDTQDEAVEQPTEQEEGGGEQAEPEKKPEPAQEEETEDGLPGRVPYSVFKKKNDEVVALKTQMQMLMDAMQADAERRGLMKKEEPAAEEANPFDKDIEPGKYFEFELNKERAERQKLAEKVNNTEKSNVQDAQIKKLSQLVTNDITTNIKDGTIPDAGDAYNYLLEAKRQEFSMISDNPVEVQQMLDNYFISYSGVAIKQGKSPAAIFKNLAKTAGYQEKPKAKEPEVKRDVEAIERNKQKSATINTGGNSAVLGGGPTNVKATLNKNGRGVNKDQFHKLLQAYKQQ